MRILANENFPGDAVEMLRSRGHDVMWVRTFSPGITDRKVIHLGETEERVIMTFDKDFGKLAFQAKLPVGCGVILFRISGPNPKRMAEKIVTTLESRGNRTGYFSVIDNLRIRMRPLPRR